MESDPKNCNDRALKPGEGDAMHSFGPVAKATERFLMILGALESGEAPLYNPYLEVSRSFIRKKTVAWKKISYTHGKIQVKSEATS